MEIRTVTLVGKQIRQAKLAAWAEANGVRIVRQIRRLPSEYGTFTVEVGVEPR
jgi:hypothetical protein